MSVQEKRNVLALARHYRRETGLTIRECVRMAAEHEHPYAGQFWN